MGPITDLAAAPPPRSSAGPRAHTGDAGASTDSFERHLEQQGAGSSSPDAKSGKSPGDALAGGRAPRAPAKLPPETESGAGADAGGAAMALAPGWQALLAQILSAGPGSANAAGQGGGEGEPAPQQAPTDSSGVPADMREQGAAGDILAALRTSSAATDSAIKDLATKEQVSKDLAAKDAAALEDGATPASRKEARAHPDRPGLAGSQASAAAYAAVSAASERKIAGEAHAEQDVETGSGTVADTRGSRRPAPIDVDPASRAPADQKQGAVTSGDGAKHPFTLESASSRDDAHEEVRTVSVRNVSTQTHFPVTGDPMSQIAAEVAQDVKAAAQTAGVAKDPPIPGQTGSKTLNIQLEPESLGAVNVRMKLTGARLTIQIDVVRPETLEMISRSQETLHRGLRNENIQIDCLTIRAAPVVDAASSAQGGQTAANQQGSGQGGSAAHQQHQQPQNSPGAFSGERPRGQREQDRSSGRSENDDNRTPRDRTAVAAHGLYL